MHDNQGLLSYLPKIEKTTFDVSLVHFLLMFGYKLFSLYYPLYLASIGISVANIGGIYFLTYSIISIACFAINYHIRKANPAHIAAAGIFGYGVFALLMLLSRDIRVFYLAQVILGVSAAAWLVSLKFILMNSETESRTKSFGWFYAMPSYATAIAPGVGGIVIWKFGFPGVFLLSVIVQFLNAIYAYVKLKNNAEVSGMQGGAKAADKSQLARYREMLRLLNRRKNVLFMLSFIFGALILGGIYRAFFVLLLKDLSFSQNDIIRLTSAISFAYVPFSILAIRLMGKFRKTRLVSGGIALEGLTAVIIGAFYSALSTGALFVLCILDSMGALVLGSGKSAFFAKKLAGLREEASAVDSIMTTLGPALGGLLGGMAVSAWGYRKTFLVAGASVLIAGVFSLSFRFEERTSSPARAARGSDI